MYLRYGVIKFQIMVKMLVKCKCLVKQGAAGIFECKCDEIMGRSNCAIIMDILTVRKAYL